MLRFTNSPHFWSRQSGIPQARWREERESGTQPQHAAQPARKGVEPTLLQLRDRLHFGFAPRWSVPERRLPPMGCCPTKFKPSHLPRFEANGWLNCWTKFIQAGVPWHAVTRFGRILSGTARLAQTTGRTSNSRRGTAQLPWPATDATLWRKTS